MMTYYCEFLLWTFTVDFYCGLLLWTFIVDFYCLSFTLLSLIVSNPPRIFFSYQLDCFLRFKVAHRLCIKFIKKDKRNPVNSFCLTFTILISQLRFAKRIRHLFQSASLDLLIAIISLNLELGPYLRYFNSYFLLSPMLD